MSQKFIYPFYMMLIWALTNVVKTYIAIEYNVNSIAFSLWSLIAASIVLISLGNKNFKMLKLSLKEKYSWGFSSFEILSTILIMCLYFYTSSTKVSILLQLGSIIAITKTQIKKKSLPSITDSIGVLIVLSTIIYVLNYLNNKDLSVMLSLTIFVAITMVSKTLCAEFNPLNKKTISYSERAQITGIILIITSVIFTATILLINHIKANFNIDNNLINYLINKTPTTNDLFRYKTIMPAVIYGVFLFSVSRFVYFKAAKIASTDNLLIIGALTPIFTWIFETTAIKLDLINKYGISFSELKLSIFAACGIFIIAYFRNKKENNEEKKVKLSA